MTDRHAIHETVPEPCSDLDWLAARFVLGELSADEEQAVAARLTDDEPLVAAVARSSRLVMALRNASAAGPRPAVPRPARGRLVIKSAVGAVAAVLALVACWPAFTPRSGPPAATSGPRELVRLWRQAEEAAWIEEEPLPEDASVDGDTVPGWMLAAVGLDQPSSLEPGLQEN